MVFPDDWKCTEMKPEDVEQAWRSFLVHLHDFGVQRLSTFGHINPLLAADIQGCLLAAWERVVSELSSQAAQIGQSPLLDQPSQESGWCNLVHLLGAWRPDYQNPDEPRNPQRALLMAQLIKELLEENVELADPLFRENLAALNKLLCILRCLA